MVLDVHPPSESDVLTLYFLREREMRRSDVRSKGRAPCTAQRSALSPRRVRVRIKQFHDHLIMTEAPRLLRGAPRFLFSRRGTTFSERDFSLVLAQGGGSHTSMCLSCVWRQRECACMCPVTFICHPPVLCGWRRARGSGCARALPPCLPRLHHMPERFLYAASHTQSQERQHRSANPLFARHRRADVTGGAARRRGRPRTWRDAWRRVAG